MTIYGAALCEGFACNVVSLQRLRDLNIYWDTRKAYNSLRQEGTHDLICVLEEKYGQFVLEYLPAKHLAAAFIARRNFYNTRSRRKPQKAVAMKWHLRLGHPGPLALEHLINHTQGVRIKGPTMVECDGCGLGKMKRQVRRTPREADEGPGERIAIDFHSFNQGYGGYRYLLLATDRWSDYMWDFYLQKNIVETIKEVMKLFINLLDKQYDAKPVVFEADNEIYLRKSGVREHLEAEGYRIEPSAPYTQAQNGLAERTGEVVKTKIRTLAQGASLPEELWPEISKAAVYLLNRTPKVDFQWKTSYEKLYLICSHRKGVPRKHQRPQLAHLKVYGCKAFALTREA